MVLPSWLQAGAPASCESPVRAIVPLAWAIRDLGRPKGLDPWPYLIFGYGTVGFALRVAALCLPHV